MARKQKTGWYDQGESIVVFAGIVIVGAAVLTAMTVIRILITKYWPFF